jgi:acyl carrier protein
MDLIGDLRKFLLEKHLLPADRQVAADESLLDAGIIDSLAVMELRTFIEREFGFTVSEDDLVPENFDSLAAMSEYIERMSALSQN